MEKSVTVRILGKDYSLRVKEADVDFTLEVASHLDTRMRAFQAAHPKVNELTTAVVTALSVTEELFKVKNHLDESDSRISKELFAMDELLARALGEEVEKPMQLALEAEEA